MQLMICKNCHANVAEEDKFCKSCGALIAHSKPTIKKPPAKRPVYWVVSIALMIIALVLIAVSNGNKTANADSNSVKAELKFEGISPEQEEKAIQVLADCGIKDIKKITHDEVLDGNGLKGYRLSTEYDKVDGVIAYFDNEKIRQVRFLDKYLYKNQEVQSVATDHFLTSDEEAKYMVLCKDTINSMLKSPSTAKFAGYNDWRFGKENGEAIVQGYVDSQNSFGAMIRADFQLKVKGDEITSFIFDGQEYIK